MAEYLNISPEISQALGTAKPVVALESAIIAHGMPYPQNLQTAREVEAVVRQHGAIPATLGVVAGRLEVGLTDQQLELFATSADTRKVSRRDLPLVLAKKQLGATTVAATLIGARLAGISVMATGGIGGVHRDGQTTLDISADLYELARARVAVVCSGAKAVLDIGRTLEVLESLGVSLVGYQTDRFPSFYCRDSGFSLPARVDSARQAAQIFMAKSGLDLEGGLLVANPVPEPDALDWAEVDGYIRKAIIEADAKEITGQALTPFLLKRLGELSLGKTLEANIALVKNNAALAAEIACALVEQKGQSHAG
jgi:pseudouridylate synthase